MSNHYTRDLASRELKFDIEHLENRLLLSGNVSVELTGSDLLKVTGDDDDNGITITNSGPNLVITPNDGESINGMVAGVSLSLGAVDPSGIRIKMKGGDDVITIGDSDISTDLNVGSKGVKVIMGSGTDEVFMFDSNVAGDVLIKMNTGTAGETEDITFCFFSGEEIDGKLNIAGSNANDDITLTGVTVASKVDIKTRAGDDDLITSNVDFQSKSTFKGGSGQDQWFNFGSNFAFPPKTPGFEITP